MFEVDVMHKHSVYSFNFCLLFSITVGLLVLPHVVQYKRHHPRVNVINRVLR